MPLLFQIVNGRTQRLARPAKSRVAGRKADAKAVQQFDFQPLSNGAGRRSFKVLSHRGHWASAIRARARTLRNLGIPARRAQLLNCLATLEACKVGFVRGLWSLWMFGDHVTTLPLRHFGDSLGINPTLPLATIERYACHLGFISPASRTETTAHPADNRVSAAESIGRRGVGCAECCRRGSRPAKTPCEGTSWRRPAIRPSPPR
jgi:hypothetical protein